MRTAHLGLRPAVAAERPQQHVGAVENPYETEEDIGDRPQPQVVDFAKDFGGKPEL